MSKPKKIDKLLTVLRPMPELKLDKKLLLHWGRVWRGTQGSKRKNGSFGKKELNRFDKKQSMDFGLIFDQSFAQSIASMLGGLLVVEPDHESILPPAKYPNVVERGSVRIVGGIRPQNYDAAYRPDGPRIVYDSKTLNSTNSIGKNWQNMVNDLVSEASTVHTRFPYCIVVFIVVLPKPALKEGQARSLVRTLERLGTRENELDQHHLAEAIAMCVWDPDTGELDAAMPSPKSSLRLEKMHERIYPAYLDRYKNLPPHEAEESSNDEKEYPDEKN